MNTSVFLFLPKRENLYHYLNVYIVMFQDGYATIIIIIIIISLKHSLFLC